MRFIITLLLVAVLSGLRSQVTFNKRYHFDFLASVGTNIIPVEDGYYFVGIVADTVAPYKTSNVFTKFDLNGEPLFSKILSSTEKTYETWQNSLVFSTDTTLVIAGESYDTTGNTIFVTYNTSGDTIFTKRYQNPFSPDYTFIQPRGGMVVLPDGGFIISNWIDNGPDSSPNTDIYAFKIDNGGNMIWDRIFDDWKRDRASSMAVDGSGNTVLGWLTTNLNQVWENFTSQVRLVKLDPEGETIWEYTTPKSIGLRDAPNDMVLLDDGSLVIATGVGTEIDRPAGNTIWFEKMLFKLSPDGDIVWETVFPDPDFNSQSKMTNVIELIDGSGFVAAGQQGDYVNNTYHHIRGWLSKISLEGQKVWERAYIGLGTEVDPEHEVYDLKECPDGGFVLAGESRDGTLETLPPQQAWLLKLDQHGCLVPGCHLLDGVGETLEPSIKLAIYPNPTSDYLNFQLRNNGHSKKGTFQIVDANGRLAEAFPFNGHAGDTFILPVWDWAAGVYYLQYLDWEGGVVVSEKFIVSH